jgi:uncharacterized protein (DUF58 family)
MKGPAHPQIRLKSRLLPVLLAAVVVMQLIDPYKGWMILTVGLGLVWLISALWARSLARHLRLKREMRFGWAEVGDQLEERFTLLNEGSFPGLWVEVLDRSDMPGYQVSRVTGVDGKSYNAWHTSRLCTRRGLFTLGPTQLRTGDPFGIYEVSLQDPASTSLMVMPPIIPLPTIEVAPGGRTGEARPRRDAPEKTVSSSSVREWAPGDSLRWIHWRTSARRDEPYVRIFDGTPAGDWWIFLDMDRTVQAGEGWESTTEHSIILAASLADRGLRLRRAVGLVANGKRLVWQPPEEGQHQRWEILRALALVDPGESSLAGLLERSAASIGRRSSLVIITPNTGTDWIPPLLHLIRRGAVPTVLLLDPETFITTADGRPPIADPSVHATGGEAVSAVDLEAVSVLPNARLRANRSRGGSGEAGGWQGTAEGGVGASSAVVLSSLADLGVSRYLIGRGLLDRPEARPGQEGRWEWKIMPTGRAVPVRRPTDAAWKSLS